MNDTVKKYLISGAYTFASTFLTILGASILTIGQTEWTWTIVAALLVAAVRSAVKAVLDQFVPVQLGGRKVQ